MKKFFCSLMIALLIFSSASPTFADSRDLYCENIVEDQKVISITRDGPESHFIVDENGIKEITSEELENLQRRKAGVVVRVWSVYWLGNGYAKMTLSTYGFGGLNVAVAEGNLAVFKPDRISKISDANFVISGGRIGSNTKELHMYVGNNDEVSLRLSNVFVTTTFGSKVSLSTDWKNVSR